MEATIVHDDSPKNSTRTIAICIDGSDFAQHALEWAVKNLLKADTDNVVLLNVRPYEQDTLAVTSFGSVDYMESTYSQEVEKNEKKRSEDLLKNAVGFLKSCNPKFSIQASALIGDPREEIIIQADKIKAHIIVVGSRGMGAVQRALIGSTSDHLTHHAHCPVIVVKEE